MDQDKIQGRVENNTENPDEFFLKGKELLE